jgi:hypothetical protein
VTASVRVGTGPKDIPFRPPSGCPTFLTPVRTARRLPGTISVAAGLRQTYKKSSFMLKQFRFTVGGVVSVSDITPEDAGRDYRVEACR